MGFMASGGEFHYGNDSRWPNWKHPSFTRLIYSDNTNWYTAAVNMSVSKEAIIKATGRVKAPLESWGRNNSPRYHADRFHKYRNCPKKMDTDVAYRDKLSIQ